MNSTLAHLISLNDVRLYSGASHDDIKRLKLNSGIELPVEHQAVLIDSNGLQIYGGYFSLFGIGARSIEDLPTWNDYQFWKFAWGSRCSDFFCFAETAFGDQYAYSISSCATGDYSVYFVDCLSMTPTRIASGFQDFFERVFIRCASDPYDVMIKKCREKLGELIPGEHVIYSPSPLFGAPEAVENVSKLNARWAMIFNGDIAMQLDALPDDKKITTVTPYQDTEGRMRLRLT